MGKEVIYFATFKQEQEQTRWLHIGRVFVTIITYFFYSNMCYRTIGKFFVVSMFTEKKGVGK
ncbi:hypothetical protein ACH33_05000 [Aneurinibacillus sp. XH2]|nr:hypothetical protein ACH33_05000 [Aneurinibacillus sp. XH2]